MGTIQKQNWSVKGTAGWGSSNQKDRLSLHNANGVRLKTEADQEDFTQVGSPKGNHWEVGPRVRKLGLLERDQRDRTNQPQPGDGGLAWTRKLKRKD